MGGVRPGNLKTLTHLKLVVKTIVVRKSLGPQGLYEFESRSRHNLKSKGVGSIPTASRL